VRQPHHIGDLGFRDLHMASSTSEGTPFGLGMRHGFAVPFGVLF